MSVDDWVVSREDAVLPQVDLPRKWALRLGGAREIGMQFLGLLSIPNGAMIGLTWFRGSEFAQSVFGSAWVFLATYVAIGLVGMALYYIVVYRAFRQFVNAQAEQEGVSPLMREVRAIHDRLDELEGGESR
jgi:hypothetical protein